MNVYPFLGIGAGALAIDQIETTLAGLNRVVGLKPDYGMYLASSYNFPSFDKSLV
jgi:hypothetical protein